MATKINSARPSTRLGLASDVRSGSYETRRVKSTTKPPTKPAKATAARTARRDPDRRVPR